MAAPFPGADFEALIYMALGALISLLSVSGVYIRRLHKRLENIETLEDEKDSGNSLRIDNIGLTKKSEDLLEAVLNDPELQSDLPDTLNVSKATVSNAVSELKERQLIKRKKKANTYLIEPDIDELESQQR